MSPTASSDVRTCLETGARARFGARHAAVFGSNLHHSAFGHRVARVRAQVHQDLFELPGIGPDPREGHSAADFDVDVAADQPPEQRLDRADDLVQVQYSRLQNLLAAECQQLTRQRCRSLRRSTDLLHVAPGQVVGRQLLEQQVRVSEDRRQYVVEIVRDAARQPSHGLHLVGLPQAFLARTERILGFPAFGDVAMIRDNGADGSVPKMTDEDRFAETARLPIDA